MKLFVFCMLILTALLNFSCGQEVKSSPIAADEIIVETAPQFEPTPNKYEEIDVIEQISRMDANTQPNSLEYKDFKINKVAVTKQDEFDGPKADIYDLVLSKNKKIIGRFEGRYNPWGNELGFGLYQFLGGSEKQLFIVDESNRYDRQWIVSLAPKYEVIFDAEDFEVVSGYLMAIDVNNDGEMEITLAKNCSLGFLFSNNLQPWARIVFKYDAKTRKYVPASHLFTGYTLKDQEENLRKFNESKDKPFSEALEIMMTYIYAGNENEAWKIFNENEIDFTPTGVVNAQAESREKIKEQILAALKKDPIYRFIKADLRKKV